MTGSENSVDSAPPEEVAYVGLAPFLRLSIANADLRPVAQELLSVATASEADANAWINLSTVMFCLGQRDFGLSMQAQALALRRLYHLPALRQPAVLRLLVLMAPGDLAANTPIDCLFEDGDIDIDCYFVSRDLLSLSDLPEHDVLMVGLSEADAHHASLRALAPLLAKWPKPVINAPQFIENTDRKRASILLRDLPGVLIPPTLRASRSALQAVADDGASLSTLFEGCDFPIILRPVGSHAGQDLDRIGNAQELAAYLGRVDVAEFFLAPFIDYSGADGQFRKFRIALIDGRPYICHMAVSAHWMVHYVNAGMYEDAAKRAEEAEFMARFDDFVKRHDAALAGIHQRVQLDYVFIDGAETRDGQLLVFEVDHAMVVHAMDSEELFPYKQMQMRRVQQACRAFLMRRAQRGDESPQ